MWQFKRGKKKKEAQILEKENYSFPLLMSDPAISSGVCVLTDLLKNSTKHELLRHELGNTGSN